MCKGEINSEMHRPNGNLFLNADVWQTRVWRQILGGGGGREKQTSASSRVSFLIDQVFEVVKFSFTVYVRGLSSHGLEQKR